MLSPIPPDDLLPNFRDVDWRYHRAVGARGDTYLHLPTLKALTERARDMRGAVDVVEFGVRAVCSTWAFIAARPTSLVSVDIAEPPSQELAAARACADEEGVAFEFVQASTLELDPIPCDVLFIDTKHTFAHLLAELERHAGAVRQFIAFHDTISYGDVSEDGTKPGLQHAVELLLAGDVAGAGDWNLRWHDERNNGLAIVERAR